MDKTTISQTRNDDKKTNERSVGLVDDGRSSTLEDISNQLKELEDSVAGQIARIPSCSDDIRTISGRLEGLTSYIEDNAKRLRRFEEGYDFQILKNFAKQIIREIHSLRKKADGIEGEGKAAIEDAVDSLVELLDRNAITQISLEPGSCYAGQERVAECAATKCLTDDESLNGRIASIVHEGYQYEFNDGSVRVLVPSKVILFSTNREQRSEDGHADLTVAEGVEEKLKAIIDVERESSGNRSILGRVTKFFKK